MPPKKATSRELIVEGVHCRISEGKKTVVVIGTGLVSNDERGTFTLTKSGGSLEDQVRAHKKFPALLAKAKYSTAETSTELADSEQMLSPPTPPKRPRLQAELAENKAVLHRQLNFEELRQQEIWEQVGA